MHHWELLSVFFVKLTSFRISPETRLGVPESRDNTSLHSELVSCIIESLIAFSVMLTLVSKLCIAWSNELIVWSSSFHLTPLELSDSSLVAASLSFEIMAACRSYSQSQLILYHQQRWHICINHTQPVQVWFFISKNFLKASFLFWDIKHIHFNKPFFAGGIPKEVLISII